ncbi:hypothetical protein KHA90_11855 [Flavobacterium psychroterrae]|uniref:Uncharacterized protein n=1 Tax=Flavobacterium psychroterrae TaxID=2133767 RepID=A0ABS5PC83_9FLAO|nr:hypothetical protein [Flavobacterium psychroterrae]MBS7231721.1 hypothetical protein [Flavobacterium psychroterrae]
MNKEVVIIGGGILGGMMSNGVSTLLPQSDSPLLNLVFAGASAFGATKVNGTSTKDNLLRGSLMGSAVVQALLAVKKVADKHLSSKLTGTGKGTLFAKGAVGLACPFDEGLNGQFMGGDGHVYEIDEQGLNGTFMDEAGNVFHTEEGLNGSFMDEAGNVFHTEEGLNGVDDEYEDGLHGAESDVYGEDERGLHGAEEEALYAELYQ